MDSTNKILTRKNCSNRNFNKMTEQVPNEIWSIVLEWMEQPWRLILTCKRLLQLGSQIKIPIEICSLSPTSREISFWLSKSPTNMTVMKNKILELSSFKKSISLAAGQGRCIIDPNFYPFYCAIIRSRPCFKYDILDLLDVELSRQIEHIVKNTDFGKIFLIAETAMLIPNPLGADIDKRCERIIKENGLERCFNTDANLENFIFERKRWINGSLAGYVYLATRDTNYIRNISIFLFALMVYKFFM